MKIKLSDVAGISGTPPEDGQVLVWNDALGVYEPEDPAGGGGTGLKFGYTGLEQHRYWKFGVANQFDNNTWFSDVEGRLDGDSVRLGAFRLAGSSWPVEWLDSNPLSEARVTTYGDYTDCSFDFLVPVALDSLAFIQQANGVALNGTFRVRAYHSDDGATWVAVTIANPPSDTWVPGVPKLSAMSGLAEFDTEATLDMEPGISPVGSAGKAIAVNATGDALVAVDFPESGGGGVEEAPEDGTIYGRQDGDWVPAPTGGGEGGGSGSSRKMPTLVQKAGRRNDGTLALPVAPTPGNLMVFASNGYDVSLGAYKPAGFVEVATYKSDANNGVRYAIRRVQSGDTGSYSITASDYQQAALYEFSGAIGVAGVNGGVMSTDGSNFALASGLNSESSVFLIGVTHDIAQSLTFTAGQANFTQDYAYGGPLGDGQNHTGAFGSYRGEFGIITGTSTGSFTAPCYGIAQVIGSEIEAVGSQNMLVGYSLSTPNPTYSASAFATKARVLEPLADLEVSHIIHDWNGVAATSWIATLAELDAATTITAILYQSPAFVTAAAVARYEAWKLPLPLTLEAGKRYALMLTRIGGATTAVCTVNFATTALFRWSPEVPARPVTGLTGAFLLPAVGQVYTGLTSSFSGDIVFRIKP